MTDLGEEFYTIWKKTKVEIQEEIESLQKGKEDKEDLTAFGEKPDQAAIILQEIFYDQKHLEELLALMGTLELSFNLLQPTWALAKTLESIISEAGRMEETNEEKFDELGEEIYKWVEKKEEEDWVWARKMGAIQEEELLKKGGK